MRKQHLYWTLTILAMLTFILLPYAQIETASALYKCRAYAISATQDAAESILTIPLLIIAIACAAIPIVCLASQKKRTRQLRLSILNALLQIGVVILALYATFSAKTELKGILSFRLTALLPLLSLFLAYLAAKFTWKDITYLKKMDRLR